MSTLPQDHLPEVAFVGRSNVGKSSLVNMVLGRRAIAYTSKTPGKTQQYNYFILNEGTDRPTASSDRPPAPSDRPPGSFHLVDMPGLGYAKVPAPARRRWLGFLTEYMARRRELRLVVHLVDSQVGVQETDRAIMRMVGEAVAARGRRGGRGHSGADRSAGGASAGGEGSEREGSGGEGSSEAGAGAAEGGTDDPVIDPIRYAVVLTKADKNDGKVKAEVLNQVRQAFISAGCPPDSPMVPTSAKSKYGRDDVWRVMRRVMLGEE